jgi:inner membrane protein
MRNKIFQKLVVLGGITILLLIALSSIGGITRERKQRFHSVQQNIAESYAGLQRVVGPIFLFEYRQRWMGKLYNKEKESWYEKEMTSLKTLPIFPELLHYDGSLQVQERYRGIYKANVFQSSGRITGSVKFPEAAVLRTEQDSKIEIVSAKACLIISDPRGISRIPVFEWNSEDLEVSAGSGLSANGMGIHAELPDSQALFGQQKPFAMDLNIHGMGEFQFVPVGSDNVVRLESAWPHPSFTGDFLAVDRSVSPEGFSAEWSVNGLASSAQRDLQNGKFDQIQYFGVSLVDPVNPYPLTDRALKYGFLFVFITFAAFFLFELVKALKIHPIQYGFVGLAQAIFFLLLLSLSEHIGFGSSYLIASVATIGVISLYLCGVLRGLKRGIFFGGILTILYGALYGLLQSEDHALVAGSALLFGLMSVVMVLTRKIDWYTLGTRQNE